MPAIEVLWLETPEFVTIRYCLIVFVCPRIQVYRIPSFKGGLYDDSRWTILAGSAEVVGLIMQISTFRLKSTTSSEVLPSEKVNLLHSTPIN